MTWKTWNGSKNGAVINVDINSIGIPSIIALNSATILAFYADSTHGYGAAIIGIVTGVDIEWQAPTIVTGTNVLSTDKNQQPSLTLLTDTEVFASYIDNSGIAQAFVIDILDGVPVGGQLTPFPDNVNQIHATYVSSLDQSTIITAYSTSLSGNKGLFVCVATVTSSVVAFNTSQPIINIGTPAGIAISAIDSVTALLVYSDPGNSNYLTGVIISFAGMMPVINVAHVIDACNPVQERIALTKLCNSLFVAYYNGGIYGNDYGVAISISNNSISSKKPIAIASTATPGQFSGLSCCDHESSMFICGGTANGLVGVTGTVRTGTLFVNTPVIINSDISFPCSTMGILDSCRIVIIYMTERDDSMFSQILSIV